MNIIVVVSCWWLLCMTTANSLNTTLDPISDQTLLLVLSFIVSLLLGGQIDKNLGTEFKPESLPEYNNVRNISLFFLCISVLVQTPLWLVILQKLIGGVQLPDIRYDIFFGSDVNKFIRFLFNVGVAVTFNLLLVISIIGFHFFKKVEFAIVLLIYIVLLAVTTGARAPIYQTVGVFLIFQIGFNRNYLKQLFSFEKIKYLALFACLIPVIIIITIMRNHNPVEAFTTYHTVGFVLLSKMTATDADSIFAMRSYGVSIFGGVDYLIGLIANFFSFGNFQSFTKATLLHESLKVSTHTSSFMVGPDHVVYQLNDHNTFYTLLASGFKSFGAFGIPILGFFLGVAVSNLKRRAIKGSLISSGYLILMISILFMGIFSSGLETLGLWLSLMSINVLFLSVNYLEKFR